MNYLDYVRRFSPTVSGAVLRVDRIMAQNGLTDCWVMRIPSDQNKAFAEWFSKGEFNGHIETFGYSKTMMVVSDDEDAMHIRLMFDAKNI